MADFFSDHYHDTSVTAASTTIDDPRIKAAPGISHSKLYYKRGSVTITTATAAADVLRFFQMKSGDRLHNLFLSHNVDASTSAAGDTGLHETGLAGALIDLNLFCPVGTAPMIDITLAITRDDVLLLGDLAENDTGKQLWQMADVGAATHTVDPFETWDITMTISAEVGIVASEYVMEAVYTSAGS